MNEYFGGFSGPQSDRDAWTTEGVTGGCAEPTSFQLADAKARVNDEFDRLSRSIAAGVQSNAGLDAGEIALLLEVLEEKRSEELNATMSIDWMRSWKLNGRARNILLTDSRAALIYRARDERRHLTVDRPVRYFGFTDEGGFRVFRFGRFPETPSSPKYRVSVSLTFFSRNKMALQDGPGFCAALLSRRAEPNDCVASLEDLDDFLASRAAKSAEKSRPRPRYDPR
jgi:hypothetical protein